GAAVRPRGVLRAREHGLGAEALASLLDLLRVRRDDDARGLLRGARALPDVLDQVLPGLAQERLPGETGRSEPRRDDHDRAHAGTLDASRRRFKERMIGRIARMSSPSRNAVALALVLALLGCSSGEH